MTSLEILRSDSIKQGDTDPPLRLKCYTEGGDPYNLSGYTVTFKMQRSDSNDIKVDAPATLEQPEVGVVEYPWSAGDTDTTGTFRVELVAMDGAGSTVSFPNDGFQSVYIIEGL